jgi:hypothetical protein
MEVQNSALETVEGCTTDADVVAYNLLDCKTLSLASAGFLLALFLDFENEVISSTVKSGCPTNYTALQPR